MATEGILAILPGLPKKLSRLHYQGFFIGLRQEMSTISAVGILRVLDAADYDDERNDVVVECDEARNKKTLISSSLGSLLLIMSHMAKRSVEELNPSGAPASQYAYLKVRSLPIHRIIPARTPNVESFS